ncbi:hypothetical protein LTR84_008396 [Exophiala bonariae]|uniref:Carboxylic ester hydrolase n=1 Tax=Exophiala bonariae TaxID=1690606 RepID=A0AAV9MX10_9EURO|nr:hypothetical protein LTR84_008396 [Exophiala bonariae]
MATTRLLGTSDIPAEHWRAAQLIDRTPFIASTFEPRAQASYCMYVPKQHYELPSITSRKLPLIVTIHGSGRRAERARESLVSLADRTGSAILAPLFPTGVGGDPNEAHNYKFLAYRGIRYDLILLAMLDEVAARWPGVATEKVFLVGFSGGGQFALRFFYLHPQRISAVSVGAPGVVTRLDPVVEWPRGIQGVGDVFGGLEVNVDKLKEVQHVQLIVGGDDVENVGGGLLQWLRMRNAMSDPLSQAVGSFQLPNRKEALESLYHEFLGAGIPSSFVVVDGVAHENMKVLPSIIEFLEPFLT